MAGAEPIQSQELLLSLPCRCRVLRLWAILDCFPRPQGGSWTGSSWMGLDPVPIWDPGVFKVRTLAARPPHQAQWVDFGKGWTRWHTANHGPLASVKNRMEYRSG